MVLIALIPSAFVALFFYSDFNAVNFFQKFLSDVDKFEINSSFLDVYRYFSMIDYGNILLWLLSALAFMLAFTIMFVVVETHMRLGVRTKKGFFRLINDSLLIILKYGILATIVYEVSALIVSGVIVITSLFAANIVVLYVSFIIYVFMLVVVLLLLTNTICVVPIVLTDGYNLRFALSYSISMISPKLKTLFWQMFLVMLVAVGAKSLAIYVMGSWVTYIASILLTMIILIFIPVFSVRNYMRMTQSLRRDIKRTSY